MKENSMGHVHLTYDKLLGDYLYEGNLDLLNIVMIGITNELPKYDEKYELHHLLRALLLKDLFEDKKLKIIETEYHISIEDEIKKDVNIMCNLSQGIKEEGIAIGKEVKDIIEGKELVLFNPPKL